MSFLIDQIDSSGLFAQSAYSASIATKDSNGNDITATYLTGVDLTPYQTTAGMTAYQTTAGMTGYATTGDVSGAEWNSCYETVYSNSGSWTGGGGGSFTGVTTDATLTGNGLSTNPLGVANVQSLTSNESINITLTGDNVVLGVADTWFDNAVNSAVTGTQGDAEVNNEVHTNSGNWNNSYTTITANSGVWGGSALPISAGAGISAGIVNNTLVFRSDETVLYSATPKAYGGNSSGESITLSENISGFERLRFYVNVNMKYASATYYESYEVDNYLGTACNFQYGPFPENNITANWFILIAGITNNICNVSATYNNYTSAQQPNWNNKWFPGSLYKVVGINRINNA